MLGLHTSTWSLADNEMSLSRPLAPILATFCMTEVWGIFIAV